MAKEPDLAASAAELRLVVGQLVRRLRSEAVLPLAQASVLSRLERDCAQTTSALAAAECVRPQSMAQTLADLEADGLVSRRPDPDDRRQVLIELTAEGRRRLRDLHGAREGWLAAAIGAELDPDEQRALIAVLPLLRRLAEASPRDV